MGKTLLTPLFLRRGKTRLAKWYAPYSVSAPALQQRSAIHLLIRLADQDEEKVKLKRRGMCVGVLGLPHSRIESLPQNGPFPREAKLSLSITLAHALYPNPRCTA